MSAESIDFVAGNRIAQPSAEYSSDPEFLRSVLTASADCIKVLDLDANLIYMSEGGQAVMEVSDFNAIRGCPWPDFWKGEGNADALAAIAIAKAGGIGHFQGSATTMLGNPRYWDVMVTPIMGPDGKPERLLSVSRDISAARQSELALEKSQRQLEQALLAANLGFWELDLASESLVASAICKSNFGHLPDGPFGYQDFMAGVHPDDGALRDAAVAHTIATADDLDVTYRFIKPDQSVAWIRIQGRLTVSPDGHAAGMSGVSLDVTASKVADEVLRQSEATLRDVAEAQGTAIAIIDRDHIYRFLNDRASELYGLIAKDVIGRHAEEALGPRRYAARLSSIESALAGKMAEEEVDNRRPDKSGYVLLFRAIPRYSSVGDVDGAYLTATDITPQWEAREQRALLNQELSHRMKNQMAVVQGIVGQTLRNATDMATAKADISARLSVLSHAHELLLEGQGKRASVRSIVHGITSLYEDAKLQRIHLTGPILELGPRAALSLALIVHELATNAVKYGSLSVPAGKLDVSWGIGELEDEPAFDLEWRESGGPAVVEPDRQGFGSRLINAGIAGASSRVEMSYSPSGLAFHIVALLASVQLEE
jgi:PAS domain S-box-containing protein